MIQGFATVEGTTQYFDRHQVKKHVTPWFLTSPIAMGTHLGEMNEKDSLLYQQSLEYGLCHGINFIDTAINYRGMKSERDIGKVLYNLIEETKQLTREEIVISTKAGIIPGDVDAQLVPKDYLQFKLIDGGIIKERDLNIVEHQLHVMAPSYYEFAIGESRKHLNLETIDIHYIHNPELSMAVIGPEVFYRQLMELFSFYEEQVDKGIIRHYGMAVWDAFLSNPDEPGYISLEKVVEQARNVREEAHHFRFIQLPYSHARKDAVDKNNQRVNRQWMSTFEAARLLNVRVTTSAPFDLGRAIVNEDDAETQLASIVNTKGILSTMVGMKHVNNVKKNIKTSF